MLKKGILVGLMLLGFSLTAIAADEPIELEVAFKHGTPSAEEFVLAAKRALFRRNYDIDSSSNDGAIGTYKGKFTMEIKLGGSGAIIRNIEPAGYRESKLRGYLKNLERDLTYELAAYIL